jgi:hypothetical protein
MTKLRFEKFADQAYYVYLGMDGPIGTVSKMDDKSWHAHLTGQTRTRICISRGEAAEWLRKEREKNDAQ